MKGRMSAKEKMEQGDEFVNNVTDMKKIESIVFVGLIAYLTMFINALTKTGLLLTSFLATFMFQLLIFGLQLRATEYLSGHNEKNSRFSPFYLSWVNSLEDRRCKIKEVWLFILIATGISFISSFSLLFFIVVNILLYMITGSIFFKMVYERYGLKDAYEEVKEESDFVFDIYIQFFKHALIGIIVMGMISIYINKQMRAGGFGFWYGFFYIMLLIVFMKDLLLFVVLPAFENFDR